MQFLSFTSEEARALADELDRRGAGYAQVVHHEPGEFTDYVTDDEHGGERFSIGWDGTVLKPVDSPA